MWLLVVVVEEDIVSVVAVVVLVHIGKELLPDYQQHRL
jgi:hypothetical protein